MKGSFLPQKRKRPKNQGEQRADSNKHPLIRVIKVLGRGEEKNRGEAQDNDGKFTNHGIIITDIAVL
jgi:hypothetical protein